MTADCFAYESRRCYKWAFLPLPFKFSAVNDRALLLHPRGLPTDRYMWSDASGLQECTKLNTKPPSPQWSWVRFVFKVFVLRRRGLASRIQDLGYSDPDFLILCIVIFNLCFPIYAIAITLHSQKNVEHGVGFFV